MPAKKSQEVEVDSPPTDIDPYETLGLESDASADDVKKAYRKLALKHHPDKAPDGKADEYKQTFQRIAFAYAVLSDPRRRSRFDATGSTEESLLDGDDDAFDWADFFRNAYAEAITTEKIKSFSATYRNSAEERGDILKAYTDSEGDMDGVYERVMLSNVLEDDERFRNTIDEAISKGEVEAHNAYTNESDSSRAKRVARAEKEKAKAEKEAAKMAKKDQAAGKAKSKRGNSEDELLTLIQSRQASRQAEGFLANLEAKYGPSPSKSGKGRRKRPDPIDEPPEEAFAATAARHKKSRGN